MNEINLYAVVAATFSSFMFGAIWYSPILFLPRWCKETGIDPNKNISNPAKVYGITFILTFISAIIFAMLLGEKPELITAILSGALVGLGLVAASMGINYQFANCTLIHWVLDGLFHVIRFSIMGLIFGLWH